MIPYILIFLIATFLYYFEDYIKNKKNLFWLFAISLACFIGFRDMLGGFDVYIYGEVYEANSDLILIYEPFEIGFRLYFYTLKLINADRYFMFFITAFITIVVQFLIIKKHTPIYLLFFPLFILFGKFTIMDFVYLRQGLAICLIWFSISYIEKRKLIPFILIVLIANTFHKSAILFLPMYFFYNFSLSSLNMIGISISTLIVAITPLSAFVFGKILNLTDDEKLVNYITEGNNPVNIYYLIEVIVIIILILFFKNKFYETQKGKLVLNGMFLYILVSLLSLTNATFVRFGWYYYFFVIIGFTYIYNFIEAPKQKGLFKNITFLYFSLIFFRIVIIWDGGDLLPYKSIFEDYERGGMWEFMEYRTK